MKNHDWSKFTKRINIRCAAADAYHAWDSPGRLESWFLRSAVFYPGGGSDQRAPDNTIVKGDRYEWMWHGWGDEVKETGEVLEANGHDLFRFSFGKAGIVAVRIATAEEQTIVELTQDHIPVDEKSKAEYHVGCLEGWTFYLANLKSVLEGGLDLRNKNLKIGAVVNA